MDASCRWCGRTLRGVALTVVTLTAAVSLAGCSSAPVGQSPELAGSYWGNAQVTNPTGNGPMVVRNGPPQNFNPSNNEN